MTLKFKETKLKFYYGCFILKIIFQAHFLPFTFKVNKNDEIKQKRPKKKR